jgi:hypothetical protein
MRRQGFLETLVRGPALSVLALLAAPAILGGKNLPAQTHAPESTKPAQQQKAVAKPAQPRRRAAVHARVAAQALTASPPPRPAPEAIVAPPPAPPAPIWPADQPPNPAKVSWDSRGLEIEASNSSLDQILHQVAADTGVKLEGLTQDQRIQDRLILDQRIFGTYGPGPARDVLAKLLDGSGCNVLMIGGRDADAPLEVVLTVSSPAGPQSAANNQGRSNPEEDDAAEPPEPEPPPPPPMITPFGNGDSGSPETPQQIMQDILDRQQKIDQQQQRQDQHNSPQQ